MSKKEIHHLNQIRQLRAQSEIKSGLIADNRSGKKLAIRIAYIMADKNTRRQISGHQSDCVRGGCWCRWLVPMLRILQFLAVSGPSDGVVHDDSTSGTRRR